MEDGEEECRDDEVVEWLIILLVLYGECTTRGRNFDSIRNSLCFLSKFSYFRSN